jgi:PilZ domain
MSSTFLSNIGSTTRRLVARVALMDVTEPSRSVLAECFRQFGIETTAVSDRFAERMATEKVDGCVVRLGPEAQSVMEAARASAANNRIVLYGFGGSAQDAMQYSRFGVNAIFTEPLERQAALKLVKATHTLVLHEFRRYVRVPVATEVAVSTKDGKRFTAMSQDISSGGISLKGEDVAAGTEIEVSFSLLTLPRIWVRGLVTWQKKEDLEIGVKFDVHDERRMKIKEWIDAYLAGL